MEPILNLLDAQHWERLADLDADYMKSVFAFRDWKVLVGKLWVTIYRLGKDRIVQMESYRTANVDRIDRELMAIAASPVKYVLKA